MAGSKDFRATIGAALRVAREERGMSREAVIFRMTQLGRPISVSTLERWEKAGTLKVEDAYYLSEVYHLSPDVMLMRLEFPPTPKELAAGQDPATAGVEEDLRFADEAAPPEGEEAPPDDEEDVP